MTQTIEKSRINDKATFVNKMFAQIAGKYDLLNDLMTFGLHKKWKEKAIDLALSEIKNPKTALDLCSGTADLALVLSNKAAELKITCVDNCVEMLDIARVKTKNLSNIEVLLMDSENMSFKSEIFDLACVGFGLRNLVNKKNFLKDVFDFLKPAGVFVCIDLGYPENILWQKIYFFYFYNLIPKLGELFAKNKGAYTYLPESLKTWYKQEELKDLILKTGFKRCYFKNLLGGAVAIHVAVK